TPERPGVNVAVLELPGEAALLNGPRAIALEVALRAMLGLVAGVGAAFALHYVHNRPTTAEEPRTKNREPVTGDTDTAHGTRHTTHKTL
ncbi:MAG TPA: hypothetical protein VFO07_11420, partial [Roseiflexaceae bacterium]|nr:hypothetical protein [Roseiflexaceae bacterium]